MVRVLQCVSATVELMGDRVAPHLATITNALPQVWQVITSRSGEGTGALARLHSSLIATVAHLVARLGAAAMSDANVSGLLLPLLQHATNIGIAECEPLMEDGMRLWQAVLQASPALPPALRELLTSRLVPILARGQDNAAVYRIAESYGLEGGLEVLQPLLPALVASIERSLRAALAHLQAQKQEHGVAMAGLSPELGTEATSAASLLVLLARLHDGAGAAAGTPPAVLQGAATAAAALLACDYGGGSGRVPPRSAALHEICAELLARLCFAAPGSMAQLCGGDADAEGRLLDRWLLLCSTPDMAEVFIPSLAAAGRARRHLATVGLCALLYADASAALRDQHRAAAALSLGLRAVHEAGAYARDRERLAELRPADPAHADQLLLRRLLLARGDTLRAVPAQDAVRAAAGKVVSWAGEEALLAALGQAPRERLLALMRPEEGGLQGGGAQGALLPSPEATDEMA